ncbi:hypothetical protein HAX54_052128 [Datura stramonium]|uniref:Uncharacterized protein n=1 Tax=Datura stramonium TaxID=4076 RepID=A0ABS8RS38_DATST|nr:hypothetical protein [Datura stramonium]
MSDKALVKHLQRELERLESEFRSPRTSLFPSDYEALLREKNRQMGTIANMTDNHMFIDAGWFKKLPKSACSEITRLSKSNASVHFCGPPSIDADIRTCSDGHSRSSSEDQIIHVPEFEENFLHNSSTPRLLAGNSNYSRSDSCEGWDEIEKQSNGTSEDLFKEVHCIETEESSMKGKEEPNFPSPEESSKFLATMTAENGDKADKGTVSPPAEDYGRLVSPSLKENGKFTLFPCKEDQEYVSFSSSEEERKSSEEPIVLPSKFIP